MQVFSTFFKIMKKQLPQCIIYFSVFAVLIIMFSSMGSDQRHDYENSELDIVVFDYDNSEESKYLVEYLDSIHNLNDVEDDEEVIQDFLYYQVIDYVLYIEDGYAETGSLSNIKRPGSNSGVYVDNQISAYEKSFDTMINSGYSVEEANKITLEALDSEGLINLKGKPAGKSSIYYFYLYIPYIAIMLLFNVLAPVVVVFNKKDVSDRADISPTTVKKRSLIIVLASILVSVATWGIFVVIATIMFGGENFKDNMIFSMLNSLTFIFLTVGLMSIFSNFDLKQQTITMISNIVGLGLSFLGGIFVPMEIFGEGLLTVAKFMPTYWYVMAHEKIFAGANASEILLNIGVQGLYIVAFIAIGLVVSKRAKLSRAN